MPSRWCALSVVALSAACAPRHAPGPPQRAPASSDRATPAETSDARPPRALLFRAAGFPTIDAPPIDDQVLEAAFAGLPVERAASASELSERLFARDVDVLVLPYGSAFPVDAWPRIQSFLRTGGGLAVLGGAPLGEPVRWENGAWIAGPKQTAFAHDFLVGPAEPVAIGAGWKTTDAPGKLAGFSGSMPGGKTTWALTLRLTNDKEFPDEHGSAGIRDAVARPLAHVLDPSGTPRGCSLLEIDRLRGAAKGARWVFATTDAKLDPSIVRAIVTRALEGASEMRIVPKHASVLPGERPELSVSVTGTSRRRDGKVRLTVSDESGKAVFTASTALVPRAEGWSASLTVDAPLAPGLHRVSVEDEGAHGSARSARTAFWVKDDKLLAAGPKLSASRDWLRKDGRPFPIVGTTYMASDVHRHFLFSPNPDAWDADFAEMKKRGVNFVRTGLWTGWSRMMPEPGKLDEGVLSALEAFVLTAARHGIVVCFNVFAFLPPSYCGTNPYLDERSLDGQKKLVTALARRFRGVGWVHWDLINEPSYAPPARLWWTRPIGDVHEAREWKAWIEQRHGTSEGKLRAIWHAPEADVFALPREEDFDQAALQIGRRPRKARDFREFAEEVVTRWAASLRAAIREAAGDTLVTLGQDEGGIHERTTQQLMAEALDYTAVHTWWKNDDLLWDGVVTKVPEKPSLHQETGLMRLENVDGQPWRTPEDAAKLLERKLGYAFAGRGAGVVEWVWNVNPYMPLDMEATIGIYRPDGTAKPELDELTRFASFFREAANHLDDFEPDPVVVVLPHARAFLGLRGALDATKHVVRTLAERYGVVPTALSDLRLSAARLARAKLVIVPAPDVLDEGAAKALLEASRTGTKILVTGAIDGDSYGMETPSLRALALLGRSRPIAMREKSAWSASGWVGFEGLLQESARRAESPSVANLSGNVWHEPLPLELARDREPLVRLLGAALSAASVPVAKAEDGVVGRVLLAPRAALVVAINERPESATRRLVVDGHPIDVAVGPRGANLLVVERASGKTIVAMPPR